MESTSHGSSSDNVVAGISTAKTRTNFENDINWRTIADASSPSMEFEDGHTRNDRSALLGSSHQERIAYDNPTAHDQVERDEAKKTTPLSPPPSYEHVLNETPCLYIPSTSSSSGATESSHLTCPHHSPRLDIGSSDSEERQTATTTESDSESQQYMVQCCCQLADTDPVTAMHQQQQQQQHHHHLLEQRNDVVTSGVTDTDTITLEANDSYPNEMFAAWKHEGRNKIEIGNGDCKTLYKMMATEGICKMSSECRCDECQSHYFDCDFDNNEHQKTDGGLGAGTPMFINEVMHGSACNIL